MSRRRQVDASGDTSDNVASGFGATASGDNSHNTATGRSANASGSNSEISTTEISPRPPATVQTTSPPVKAPTPRRRRSNMAQGFQAKANGDLATTWRAAANQTPAAPVATISRRAATPTQAAIRRQCRHRLELQRQRRPRSRQLRLRYWGERERRSQQQRRGRRHCQCRRRQQQ